MKMMNSAFQSKILLLLLLGFILTTQGSGMNTKNATPASLLSETLRFFSHCRLENGLYLDRLSLLTTEHPDVVSISSTGVGLLSEVIAWKAGLQSRDEVISRWNQSLDFLQTDPSVLHSLRAGFYAHFYNGYGNPLYGEYSTVDNALFQIALLWGAEKINDPEITTRVLGIFHLTDWPACCYGSEYVYREVNADGSGSAASSSFNEYCLVAWLASLQAGEASLQNHSFLRFFPGQSASVDTYTYEGIDLISDSFWHALSPFVPLFSWFFCPPLRPALAGPLQRYRQADSLYFSRELNTDFGYGMGSGSCYQCGSGYSVESIGNNPHAVVSPATLASYGVLNEHSFEMLERMADEGRGRYLIPGTSDSILWRFSLLHGNFATEVQSIDMTNLLLGLAYRELGAGFFDFVVPVEAKELNYTAFTDIDQTRDVVVATDSRVFVLHDRSCYYKNGNGFTKINLGDDVNDIALSEQNLYAACDDHIYRVPLNSLSLAYTEDTWTWDEYTQLLVRPNDELFYFINSFGSRSGWTYRFAHGSEKEYFWGQHGLPGFLDQQNLSLVYVASTSNDYLRVNVTTGFIDSLRHNIQYAGLLKGQSVLLSATSYSLDFGASWFNYSFPECMNGFQPAGFCALNDSVFAVVNSSNHSVCLIVNGSIQETATFVPPGFQLKACDPEKHLLWGFVGNSNYSSEGILVSVALDQKQKNTLVAEEPATVDFYPDSLVQVPLQAEAQHGAISYASQQPEVVTVDGQGMATFHRGGKALVSVWVDETDEFEGARTSVLLTARHHIRKEEKLCDRSVGERIVSTSEIRLTSIDGLDSVLHRTLYTYPEYYQIVTPDICAGESYDGYNASGTYYRHFTTYDGGCD
ncbi:MAG TPA: hypothetical protein PLK12_16885, partial [Prolixibacteraceae bacterium]|nr:hypothetical protein [Prolixibacteraceae bacterium]